MNENVLHFDMSTFSIFLKTSKTIQNRKLKLQGRFVRKPVIVITGLNVN